MVKLYKRTVVASIGAAVVFFAISVVCELWKFNCYAFIQNYCTGIACSLIVVIITSQLQYKHEHNKLFEEYSLAAREMVSVLGQAFCGYEDGQLSDKLCESLCAKIKEMHDLFDKYDKELIWFSKRKAKQQDVVRINYKRIYMDFFTDFYRSKKTAFARLRFHKDYIPLIDSALALIQNESDRYSIEDSRRFALECLRDKETLGKGLTD